MDVASADGDVAARSEDRDDVLRAALLGIETSAHGLRRARHRLTTREFEAHADGLVAEVRRVRAMLDGRNEASGTFDLADAVGPAIASVRASGLDVRSSVSRGIDVTGRLDSAAKVLLAVLDNARTHAGRLPVDVRVAELPGAVELYVEDRGPGISGRNRYRLFQRDARGEHDTGSGLFVARHLMAEQRGSIAYRPRPGGGSSFVLRFRRPSSRPGRARLRPAPRSATLRDVSKTL